MSEPDAITEDELLAILRRAEAVKDNGPATYDHATRVALADVPRLMAEIHRLKDRVRRVQAEERDECAKAVEATIFGMAGDDWTERVIRRAIEKAAAAVRAKGR